MVFDHEELIKIDFSIRTSTCLLYIRPKNTLFGTPYLCYLTLFNIFAGKSVELEPLPTCSAFGLNNIKGLAD